MAAADDEPDPAAEPLPLPLTAPEAAVGPTLICVVPAAQAPAVASTVVTVPAPETQRFAFVVSDCGATVTLPPALPVPVTLADAGPTSMSAEPWLQPA